MNLKSLYRHYTRSPRTADRRVSYYNFWSGESAEEIWFTGFLRHRGYMDRFPKSRFAFFSTLGEVALLRLNEAVHPFGHHRHRIFFSGENTHQPRFADYSDHMLGHRSIGLAMGFDVIDDPRYMRFPLWLLEIFPPQSTPDDIRRICHQLSHPALAPDRDRFCALVSGNRGPNDEGARLRTTMVEAVGAIASVDCAGRLLHNTDELQTRFHDDKAAFLRQYKFYICPENSQAEGYVTEKLLHCIGSGCVPIYTGAFNRPEPDVLNPNAILFWDREGDNNSLLRQLDNLWHNPHLYSEFHQQPRLQPDAWQVVAQYFADLDRHLEALLTT